MALSNAILKRVQKNIDDKKNVNKTVNAVSSQSNTSLEDRVALNVALKKAGFTRHRDNGLLNDPRYSDYHQIAASVDDSYIDKYVSDRNSHFDRMKKTYDGLNWRTSQSKATDSLTDVGNDLLFRSAMIRHYLGKNKDQYEEESYNAFLSDLDSADEYQQEMSRAFSDAKKFYSQWKTEDEYNAWEERKRVSDRGLEEFRQANAANQGKEESFIEKISRYLGASSDTTLPNAGMMQVADSYRRDTSYKTPGENWNQDQLAEFGYLYAQSPQRAEEYAIRINDSINDYQKATQAQRVVEDATSGVGKGLVHTVGSVLGNTTGLADYLHNAAEYAARGRITEKNEDLTPFEYSQAITSGVSQKLNDRYGTIKGNVPVIGGKGLGDLYGLGTSIAQSALAGATLGSAGTLVQFFGSAAASGIDDAKNRGASDEQALQYGMLAGIAEGAAEMFGVDSLMKIGAASTMRQVLKNVAKQGLAEGAEEGITSVLNAFSDRLVMGDKSNFSILVRDYMDHGWSEAEARTQAWKDMAEDVAYDMLGGFVSGAVHAGPQTAYESVLQNREYRNIYGENAAELVQEGLQSKAGSLSNELAVKYQEKLSKGETLTGAEINRLVKANEQSILAEDLDNIRNDAAELLTTLGEQENVMGLADVIAKKVTKQKITRQEQAMLDGSSFGTWILDELSMGTARAESLRPGIERMHETGRDYQFRKAQLDSGRAAPVEHVKQPFIQREMELPRTPVATEGSQGKPTVPTAEQADRSTNKLAEQGAGSFQVSKAGKTVQLSTGKNVTIAKVSQTDGMGRMLLELENGASARADDIAYADRGEAILYESVAKLGVSAETANNLIDVWKAEPAGITAEAYAAGMLEAFQYGHNKLPKEELVQNRVIAALTDKQRNTAYELGRAFGGELIQSKEANAQRFRMTTIAQKAAQKAVAEKATSHSLNIPARLANFDDRTGEQVSVAEILSMDDHKMTFRLSNGETVTDDDLSFEGDHDLLSTVWDLDMDVKRANVVVSESANNTASDEEQAAGIQEAHHYGVHGYSMEQLVQHGADAAVLTGSQRKAAWEAGHQVYLQKGTAAPGGGRIVREKNTGVWFDAGNGNVRAFDSADMSGLSETAVTGARTAQVLQKLGIGRNYYFYESYVNEAGDRVYKDDKGNERSAPNGWYNPADGSIHIDLNAGADGKGLTLYTLSHELTHFVEEWSKPKYRAMADFLVTNYAKAGSVDAMVAEKKAQLSSSRGVEVSYDEAYSEFIADSMEAMLSDGNVLEKLQDLEKKDRSLFDKIKEFFENLVKKIRDVYKDLTPDSAEGKIVQQMKDQIDQIQQLFAEALSDAGENFRAAIELGFEVDVETESVAPSVAYSERTWNESDYVQERKKAAEEIHKAIGVSVQKAEAYIDSVNSVAKMIAEDRTRLDYFSSPGRSSFVGNVEYGGSFDFSTLCKKRRLLTGTFTAIQKALPNTALTANEILDIRNRMKDAGLEVSCGLCYVEGSRANMGQFAKEFLRLYKQYYPDAWQPNMADVNTPDGIEWVRINHPECYEQYEYFWNHYGTLKIGDKNLFASQQKPKLYQLHTEYKGEILQKFKGDDNVEEKNLNGGIRLQSFSDFEIVHLIDTMQIIMDMSRVGLAGQAYTKVPDFAWALGDTGLKINLSLIAKGVDADGKLIFDDIEGMPIAEAMRLRDRYSKNVGTILVAFNDEQLMAAMADDRVDFIIPFHRSQWKKSQYEAMGLPARTKDYTYMQNEKFIKPQYHEYRGRMVQDKATNYMPNEYWDFSKTGKENAIAYLEMCARNNKRPKFYKLLQNNGDGSYSLKADGSTDGYWKLLIDFKMYDNDGNGSPQMPVKPDFNMEEATRMLKDYAGGHSGFPVAQGIVHDFVKEYKQKHEGLKFSNRKKVSGFIDYDVTAAVYEIRNEKAERGRDLVKIGTMPALYHELFGLDGDVYVSNSHLYQNMVSRTVAEAEGRFNLKDHADYHGLGEEKIINAIEQFQDPLLVMESLKDFNEPRLVALLEEKGNDGQNLIAVLELYSPIRAYGSPNLRSHVLMTIYEKNSLPDYIEKTVDKGRILHKKQGLHQIRQADLQLVGDVPEETLKKNVARFNKKVKAFKEQNNISYQDRSAGTSNRALLASAFEELVTSPDELKFIQQYKENVALLNEQEAKLQDIRAEIREISFGKGERDTKRLQQLQEEATKTANRIDIYDRKLLKLERAKPLRDVLDREREKVRKATRQKGQEAMAEYREKRMDSAAKKDARRKIRKTVMELDKLMNRGDKKRNVKDGMNAMVSSSLKLADALFMDEYSNRDMVRNGVGVELTDAEEKVLREAQQLMQRAESATFLENRKFESEEEARKYLQNLEHQLSSKMSALKDVFIRERKRLYGTTVSDLLGKLADEYNRLSEAEDGAVRAAKDENVYAHLLQLQKDIGGTTVKDMTLGQMKQVAEAFTMVLTTVRNANKMFAKNLNFKRDVLAGMVMDEIGSSAKKNVLVKPGKNTVDSFSWNNLKPVYAFERLGSATLKTLYQNIRNGQDVWSRDMQEADDFRREQYKKHNRKSWNLEKQHSFEFASGKVDLSLEQIMSLYAYSRREAALDHLLKGGFVFSGNTEVVVKKNGIQHRYLKKDATAYNLTADELEQVIDTLTKEQKAFVEEMQTYLSDVMGGKGNEISLQMYGIRSFGEKNYFPLRSAGQYMEKAKEDSFRKEQGQISIANSSFTKATMPHASNPITLDSFMNVWAEHVNDMSMYHGFVLPMEDFRRVYNYSTPNIEDSNSRSVNAAIENTFGKAATAYIDQLYKDLNGGAVSDNRENLSKKMVSLHKKAAVFASASVVIQQPSAIIRAFSFVDPKHFIGPKVDRKRHKVLWEEVKKYAPVAFVKEMGYFDTGMGRSANEFLQAEEYSGIREKAIALFKDGDYRDEILGKAPALADEITWCSIWEAVKRETKAHHPGMDVRSDAFLQMAGERFSEVIDKTQVYDSVLSRSANMRSKALHMNMLTSFMAEPTTSINMLEDALRSGDKKKLMRTAGAVYGSILLNSLLVSFVYAARDDDEDETYWEKYLSSLAAEAVDGVNPITYYPILRDIWSIGQGFDVERSDMTLITDFVDAVKKVAQSIQKVNQAEEEEQEAAIASLRDSMWGLVGSFANLFGLPLKNIRRDVNGAVSMIKTISTDLSSRDTTALSRNDAVWAGVMNSIPIAGLFYDGSKQDRLYNATIAGDSEYVNRLRETYKTDKAYHAALKKGLRKGDERIREAAIAWNEEDMETYLRIAKQIIAEKNFIQDDVVLAIRAEASSMAEVSGESADKVDGYFTSDSVGVVIAQNDLHMMASIRDDIIDTAVANGKTREEAEHIFVNTVKNQVKDLVVDEVISSSMAEKVLLDYADFDSEKANDTVLKWTCEADTGISYDDARKAFLDHELTERELKDIYVTYGGYGEEDAEEKVSVLSFIREHPACPDISYSAVQKYNEFCQSAGVKAEIFYEVWKFSNATENDVDEKTGKAVAYSAVKKIMAKINGMTLTADQKTAVAQAMGWKDSTIRKYKLW